MLVFYDVSISVTWFA